MKIYSTWKDEFSAFQWFFKGHEVLRLPKDYEGLEMDLLLFPGGEDVSPKRYGGKVPNDSSYGGWVDEARDEWEMKVFNDWCRGKIVCKKTLGICRGMQFLNVALGGSLVYDIYSRFGRSHPNIHDIVWQMPTIFSKATKVNSIHHQAVYGVGDNRRYRILAVEPNTSLPEAILWGDSILGMQFHPELMGDAELVSIFAEGIQAWVDGKAPVIDGMPIDTSKPRRYTATFSFAKAEEMLKEVNQPTPTLPEWFTGSEEEEEEDFFNPDEEEEEEDD